MTSLFPYREAHPDGLLKLVEGEVRLWCVPLNASADSLAKLTSVLNEAETDRAERFRFPQHRAEFVAARGLLRYLLARFTGDAPGGVKFRYGLRGKPELNSHGSLRFNLSHSGGMALYAFALNSEWGVDIEHQREMSDLEGVAKRFFAPREFDDLMALRPDERSAAFFRCWTRKESFVKAIGDGLYLPLDSFRVSLRAGGPAAILAAPPGEAERWQMTDVTPLEEYAAALVTKGHSKKISGFRSTGASELLPLLTALD